MAESLQSTNGASAAAAENKDKRPNSASSEGPGSNIEDMAEWERRLAEGDLPDDFLEVTEPQNGGKDTNLTTKAATSSDPNSSELNGSRAPTGLLVDIPTVTSSNSVPEDQVPPPNMLQGSLEL